MTDAEIERLLREVLHVQNVYDEEHACPRCGRMTMQRPENVNHMSGFAPLRICDKCKADEISREFDRGLPPLPIRDWAIIRRIEGRA